MAEAKATKCIMIGYSDNHAGDTYRMYRPDTQKVINTRNIKWGEWHGKSNITTDMTVYDITENVKIPPAIVVPLPVFGDGASTPATTIPPLNLMCILPTLKQGERIQIVLLKTANCNKK